MVTAALCVVLLAEAYAAGDSVLVPYALGLVATIATISALGLPSLDGAFGADPLPVVGAAGIYAIVAAFAARRLSVQPITGP